MEKIVIKKNQYSLDEFFLYETSKIVRLIEAESRLVLPKGWVRSGWRVVA